MEPLNLRAQNKVTTIGSAGEIEMPDLSCLREGFEACSTSPAGPAVASCAVAAPRFLVQAAPQTGEHACAPSTIHVPVLESGVEDGANLLELPCKPAHSSAPPDDFERLFAQWREGSDPKIRERLILMHRNLVTHVARRFGGRGELSEDVIQCGLLGLINALDHFDPARGVRFVTFATPNIAGEIRRYFRDKNAGVRVPRRLQELNVLINHKIEALTHELDRPPTYHEVGRALSIDVEEIAEVLDMSRILEPLSLDEPSSEEEESGVHLRDQVGGPDPDLEAWSEHAILAAALDKLPQPQRRVLELAYFDGHSQVEIARRLSVSQMHVSRVQRRALSQLRILMEEV